MQKVPHDKSRPGVRGWNPDGTEDWKKHDWFYKYIPQYIDGMRMRDYHKKEYDRKRVSSTYKAITISFSKNKEEEMKLYEVARHHLPVPASVFVKECLKAYADYYHIFDEFEDDDDSDDDYY